jgi:hypothetical protein
VRLPTCCPIPGNTQPKRAAIVRRAHKEPPERTRGYIQERATGLEPATASLKGTWAVPPKAANCVKTVYYAFHASALLHLFDPKMARFWVSDPAGGIAAIADKPTLRVICWACDSFEFPGYDLASAVVGRALPTGVERVGGIGGGSSSTRMRVNAASSSAESKGESKVGMPRGDIP